jgi:proteasome lid subunit RPN8/RPN11
VPNAPEIPSSSLTVVPSKKILLTWLQAMDHLNQLGMEGAPEEVCGLLIPYQVVDRPDDPPVWEVHQLINRSDNRSRSYAIDPQTIADLNANPADWGEVRVWHTHPRGNPGPSIGDLEYAQPGIKYVVVAVPQGDWEVFEVE